MGATQVIANYESLSELTGQMLVAAREGEWEQLISFEQQCSQLVATMKPLDAAVTLDEISRQRKSHLIHKILAEDAEIRQRVQDWMRQLELSMHSNRQQQRLLQAYGV